MEKQLAVHWPQQALLHLGSLELRLELPVALPTTESQDDLDGIGKLWC